MGGADDDEAAFRNEGRAFAATIPSFERVDDLAGDLSAALPPPRDELWTAFCEEVKEEERRLDEEEGARELERPKSITF
jgi:hypothetical protein